MNVKPVVQQQHTRGQLIETILRGEGIDPDKVLNVDGNKRTAFNILEGYVLCAFEEIEDSDEVQ